MSSPADTPSVFTRSLCAVFKLTYLREAPLALGSQYPSRQVRLGSNLAQASS